MKNSTCPYKWIINLHSNVRVYLECTQKVKAKCVEKAVNPWNGVRVPAPTENVLTLDLS